MLHRKDPRFSYLTLNSLRLRLGQLWRLGLAPAPPLGLPLRLRLGGGAPGLGATGLLRGRFLGVGAAGLVVALLLCGSGGPF